MSVRLVTIGLSHYCEKARWALDRAGWRYREERHIPLLHYLASVPSFRQRTLPVLVTPHGRVGDSTEIIHFVDRSLAEEDRLFPDDEKLRAEVTALEEEFDRRLGPSTRRFAYFHFIQHQNLFVRTISAGMGPVPRAVAVAMQVPLRAGLRRGLNLTPEGVERCRKRIEDLFMSVDERLADGRKFLVGDRFTAADLTFAALAAPLVVPPEYGAWLPSLDDLPPNLAREVEAARARPAGQFALRIFKQERARRVGRAN